MEPLQLTPVIYGIAQSCRISRHSGEFSLITAGGGKMNRAVS